MALAMITMRKYSIGSRRVKKYPELKDPEN